MRRDPSCREILERLHTFVDRELAPEEVREVQDHLLSCPPCHEHFTFEVGMKRLVHRCVYRDAAPPTLRARIVRACAGSWMPSESSMTQENTMPTATHEDGKPA